MYSKPLDINTIWLENNIFHKYVDWHADETKNSKRIGKNKRLLMYISLHIKKNMTSRKN